MFIVIKQNVILWALIVIFTVGAVYVFSPDRAVHTNANAPKGDVVIDAGHGEKS